MTRKLKTIFITDQQRIDAFKVIPKLPRNSAVIFRDYAAPQRAELGKKIKKLCRKYNISFLVAKDFRLAVKLNADGMHLPEFMISRAIRAKRHNKNWLVSAACHSRRAIIRAEKFGADIFMVSPIFDSGKKTGMGALKARNMTKYYKNCVVLGGISARNIKQLQCGGFAGVAGVSGIV